ncbi:hypothetical protein DPMN_059489 [Dreissena polymorpha]|uniref:Uncharacterized protein n=1 Tax=Dreissena polymorpha TaxID=45954 RepID=A0A9D4C449_DREPO|nr:hypothetical protein DPMN_059489 [Dreissena polymorpha]
MSYTLTFQGVVLIGATIGRLTTPTKTDAVSDGITMETKIASFVLAAGMNKVDVFHSEFSNLQPKLRKWRDMSQPQHLQLSFYVKWTFLPDTDVLLSATMLSRRLQKWLYMHVFARILIEQQRQRLHQINQKSFNSLKFEMKALFDGIDNLPNRPLYVHDSKIGIVQSIITANVSKIPRIVTHFGVNTTLVPNTKARWLLVTNHVRWNDI